MIRRFTAPGKLVLMGEYAVLDGAPALVAAVDRGVRCTLRPAPQLRWNTPGDDRFVRAVLSRPGVPPAHYEFRDSHPTDAHSKLGFGGSAAATVVATLASRSLAGLPVRAEQLFAAARRIHHQVQGSGSGVDVAASVWGGLIRFSTGGVEARPPREFCVVWSGRSAQTGPRVSRYMRWPEEERHRFARRSTALVEAFSQEPIRSLRAARRELEAMATSCGLDYRTPALDRIVALAEQHGGAAKASGAGGGDCAIALFPDVPTRRRFICHIEREPGLSIVPTDYAPGAQEEA